MDRVLTPRELNRAALTRQMLLDREALPVPNTAERLVGLQAQAPNPPCIGLWTRLQGFRRPVQATFVFDGFASGTWRVERTRSVATLVVESFQPLSGERRVTPLSRKGERLLRFVEHEAEAFEVRDRVT